MSHPSECGSHTKLSKQKQTHRLFSETLAQVHTEACGLTCDERVRSGLLFPPSRNKDGNILVASFQKPIHC